MIDNKKKLDLWALNLDLKKSDMNLGRSKMRWILAICLGVVFLFSLFAPFAWKAPFVSLGVFLFWITLFLGWPKRPTDRRQIFVHVFSQAVFWFVFVMLISVIGDRTNKALLNVGLFKFFYILIILLVLKLNHMIFGRR